MKNVLILGATSAIAEDFLGLFPKDIHLYLVGRNAEKLQKLQQTLSGQTVVETIVADFDDVSFDPSILFSKYKKRIDTIVSFTGSMGNDDQMSPNNLQSVHAVNFINPAKVALFFATCMEENQHAQIAFISSVAGDRGRKKNFIYGSAKGALTIFSSGLRGMLAEKGIQVTTILLGLVDTPMTAGMKSPLIASRPKVAEKIYHAIEQRKDVVYIPGFWRWIMLIIRCVPEKMFKKMSF